MLGKAFFIYAIQLSDLSSCLSLSQKCLSGKVQFVLHNANLQPVYLSHSNVVLKNKYKEIVSKVIILYLTKASISYIYIYNTV